MIFPKKRFSLFRITPSQNPASRGADGAFELIFPVDFSLVVSLAMTNGPVRKMFLRERRPDRMCRRKHLQPGTRFHTCS